MKRFSLIGFVLGTAVALGISAWGHLSDSGLPSPWVHYAWPTDLLLLPFAGALNMSKAAAIFVSALLNGLLYGLIFGGVYFAVRKKQPTVKLNVR
jgi:hypothetical protein